jgi:hypothetical protein
MLASPAAGQGTACADRERLVEFLMREYQEALIAQGVVSNGGHLMELFTSDAGGSWTLVVSQPSGLSCMIAAGEGWQFAEPRPEGTAL